jgi:hypothetical protein
MFYLMKLRGDSKNFYLIFDHFRPKRVVCLIFLLFFDNSVQLSSTLFLIKFHWGHRFSSNNVVFDIRRTHHLSSFRPPCALLSISVILHKPLINKFMIKSMTILR